MPSASADHDPVTYRPQKAGAVDRSSSIVGRLDLTEILIAVLLVLGFSLGPLKLLGVAWVSYLAPDGLAMLIVIVAAAKRLMARKPVFAASPMSVPVLLLGGLCILEVANPEAVFIRSILGLRSWLLYLALYFVGFYSLRSSVQVERLYALLLALGFVTALYGIYQWMAGPQSFASWSEDYGRYAQIMWSGGLFRAFSTFVLPNTFGSNMAFLMLLALSVAASPEVRRLWKFLAVLGFAVMGAGIAASGSRGPVVYLAIATVLGLFFTRGFSRRLTVGLSAVLMATAAVALALFAIGPIVSGRFMTILDPQAFFWKWFLPLSNGIQIAHEHPLGMGLGYTAGVPQFLSNRVFHELPITTIDSGYGSAVAELGFIGLAVFFFFALKVGIEGFRVWRRVPEGRLRDLLLGPALMAGAYPIVSVIAQPQASLPSSIYFWLLMGMLMKAPALQRELNADQLSSSQVHARQ